MRNGAQNTTGLNRLQQLGLAFAVLGILGMTAGLLIAPPVFFQAYLFGWVFWMNLTLGCFSLTLLHHAIRANWSKPVLRLWEAGSRMIPWMGLLFAPVVLAVFLGQLYPWANHDLVAQNAILRHKSGYLNPVFFTIRTVLYIAVWWFWSAKLNNSSVRQDENGDPREMDYRANWAAPGMVVFAVTITLAVTDWVMSLDPHWFSTVYAFWFIASQALGATAFVCLVAVRLYPGAGHREVITPQFGRDIGNLLLTLTMLWAYLSLSQFLIIYSGNLPEEITYYLERMHGFWWFMGTFIVIFQFFVPFVLLLSGRTKRLPDLLWKVAVWILIMRVIDIFWTVIPFFQATPGRTAFGGAHWLDLAAFLAIGGVWLAGWTLFAKRYSLLPAHVPSLHETEETLEHA